MTLYVLLAIGLALWGYGLWSRGFFSSQTSPLDRQIYAVRVALWLVSLLIVAWPLHLYRPILGDLLYVLAAVAVLAIFFGLGIAATRLLVKFHESRP